MTRSNKLWGVLFIAIPFIQIAELQAQEIDIRLSVKYILNDQNMRPEGYYSTEQNIYDVIDETNRKMKQWGRGYQFVIYGNIEEVSESTAPNSSQFFIIDPMDENHDLEDAARNNPTGYFWRDDAINVYIVACCAAAGTLPSNAWESTYRVVYFSSDVNNNPSDPGQNARLTIWAHELGHHFDLAHTWDENDIADLKNDPTPLQCSGPADPNSNFSCTVGGGDNECCCSTKVTNLDAASGGWTSTEYNDLRYNVMGYYGAVDCYMMGEDVITIDNMRLTPGQLDHWADSTRQNNFNSLSRIGEVTGITYFVDGQHSTGTQNGYSTTPYQTVLHGVNAAYSGGGDIVLIRPGVYPENVFIDKKVTLRSSQGVVSIGN